MLYLKKYSYMITEFCMSCCNCFYNFRTSTKLHLSIQCVCITSTYTIANLLIFRSVPFDTRIDAALEWLDLPQDQRYSS